jgi:hypothetical protein
VVAFHRSTEHMHICVHGTTGLRVRRMRGRKMLVEHVSWRSGSMRSSCIYMVRSES